MVGIATNTGGATGKNVEGSHSRSELCGADPRDSMLCQSGGSVSSKHPSASVRVSRRAVVEEMWNEEFEDLFFSWERLTNPEHRRLVISFIRALKATT